MRIVSWNSYGADAQTLESLEEQLRKKQIDLCVLQETHAQDDSWYDPLRKIPNYGLVPAVPENETRTLPTGKKIYQTETIRGYAVVWNMETVSLSAKPYLVDYITDGYWSTEVPCDQLQATQKGFNQRPPLVVPLTFGKSKVTAFTWHAPLDQWNTTALDLFSRSQTLAQAKQQPTVIAGDLNSSSVSGYFQGFNGLQQKNSRIDYVLANTPLDKVTEIPGLNVRTGSHWAVAAEVSW